MHRKHILEIERHNGYLAETEKYYKDVAESYELGYKPTHQMVWNLPDLNIPQRMYDMSFSAGTTVYPQDLAGNPTVLYVGAGGGLELLEFAYFSRKPAGVVGIDIVDDMIVECKKNLLEAEKINDWFESSFVDLRKGDALYLPLEDNTIDVAAQNCLFNIFKMDDLKKALCEMYRVLKNNGRLVLSDPICNQEIPSHIRNDAQLRAMCISGAIPLRNYINLLKETGFGTVEIRGRWPYRVIDPHHFDVEAPIFVESIEVCAKKNEVTEFQVFSGRRATYYGNEEVFSLESGPSLPYNRPVSVSDQWAERLSGLNRDDIHISESTFFYNGDLCC